MVFIYPYLIVLLASIFVSEQIYAQRVSITSNKNDLSGKWGFRIDSLDAGVKEQWFNKK